MFMQCQTCQKEFTPKKKTAKYCSKSCASSAPRKHKNLDTDLIISLYNQGIAGYEIAKQMDVNQEKIYRVLKEKEVTRSNKENSVKYFVNHHYFDEIDNRDKAYWLGFMYADGYIIKNGNQKCVGVTLATKDRDHLEKMKSALDSTHPIHDYESKDGNLYSKLLITSDRLFDSLEKLGCTERKTDILKFPLHYFVPKVYQQDFIRGYFDGDGSFSKNSPKAKLPYSIKICGTHELIEGIISASGIERYHISKRHKNDSNNFTLEVCEANEVMKFANYMYRWTRYAMTRKYERYQELKLVVYTGNSVDY